MMGSEKDIKLSENERNIVAYHEAVMLSIILRIQNPVKVSIIPVKKEC